MVVVCSVFATLAFLDRTVHSTLLVKETGNAATTAFVKEAIVVVMPVGPA